MKNMIFKLQNTLPKNGSSCKTMISLSWTISIEQDGYDEQNTVETPVLHRLFYMSIPKYLIKIRHVRL